MRDIINKYNITCYLPHHHWEDNYHIDNVKYINTPLIFEEYFAQNLIEKNVTIYTFFSTAALNIASFPNVKIISIKPKSIKEKQFLEVYDIFERMGIEIIEYDDTNI